MEEVKTKRQSNIELLRIIAMLLIVFHHFAIHGIHRFNPGIYEALPTASKLFVDFSLPGGLVGVGIFFMITGYFRISKEKISLLKVILEAMFYGICLSIVILVSVLTKSSYVDYSNIQTAQEILKHIFNPATSYAWWFLSSYVILILLSPLINKVFYHIDLKGYLILLIVCFICVYTIDRFVSSDYYSITRGILFYLIGGFIFRFVKLENQLWLKRIIFISLFIIGWSLFAIYNFFAYNPSIYELNSFLLKPEIKDTIEASLLAPISIVSLFLFFQTFSFESKGINFIAKTTFGIYLIHDSHILRNILWKSLLPKGLEVYQTNLFILYGLGISILVFISCMLIDILRILFAEKYYLPFIKERINSFFNHHMSNDDSIDN